MSILRRCLRLVVLLTLGYTAAAGRAQSLGAADANDPLSRGAAAYASGDRAQAIDLLADAMRRDPHDPRPYYLRALCLARTGHPVEARADLVVAAALEARSPDRYAVEDSLSQLATTDRTLLNQFRWRAQNEDFARAFDQGLIAFAERPLPAVRTDAGVLRQKTSVPLGSLTKPQTLAELADIAARQPAAVAVETGSNPFSDDPAAHELPTPPVPAAATAAADPFGEPASDAANTPAETAAAAEPADPFAGDTGEPVAAGAGSGKLTSGKLFGILGRAVARATPLPALDRVREQLPDLPVPLPGNPPAAGPTAATPADASPDPFGSDVQGTGSEVQPTAFSEDSEFGAEPAADAAQPPAEEQPAAEESQPASTPEEDPFG